MSVSPSIQAIICEEIFDESSHPSLEGKFAIPGPVTILDVKCIHLVVLFVYFVHIHILHSWVFLKV